MPKKKPLKASEVVKKMRAEGEGSAVARRQERARAAAWVRVDSIEGIDDDIWGATRTSLRSVSAEIDDLKWALQIIRAAPPSDGKRDRVLKHLELTLTQMRAVESDMQAVIASGGSGSTLWPPAR